MLAGTPWVGEAMARRLRPFYEYPTGAWKIIVTG